MSSQSDGSQRFGTLRRISGEIFSSLRPYRRLLTTIILLLFVLLIVVEKFTDGWVSVLSSIGVLLLPVVITIWLAVDSSAIEAEANTSESKLQAKVSAALSAFSQEIKSIADTPPASWDVQILKDRQTKLLERLVAVLSSLGIERPRACLYKVNEDAERALKREYSKKFRSPIEEGFFVDELSLVTHYGRRKPKDIYRRIGDDENGVRFESRRNQSRENFENEYGCEGLFEPLTTMNVSRENDRNTYGRTPVNWRSSTRVPLFVGDRQVDYLLTVDSEIPNGVPEEVDEILKACAHIITLLSTIADGVVSSEQAQIDMIRIAQDRGLLNIPGAPTRLSHQ